MIQESFLIYHVVLDEEFIIAEEREVTEELISLYIQKLGITREEANIVVKLQNTFEENRTLSEVATLLRYWHHENALGPIE